MAFHCLLTSPAGMRFDGDVWQVTVPSTDGLFSIRTGHVPVIAMIKNGILEIARSENDRIRFTVTSGVAEHTTTNGCRIVCESAEPVA